MTIESRADWLRLVAGLYLVFGLFHFSATALGSDRGQRGVVVGALVVIATAAAHRLLIRTDRSALLGRLGFVRPQGRGIVASGAAAALLLTLGLLFLHVRGIGLAPYPGWLRLLPGLFAQAGIAEEVLFRGYLFSHVRAGRTFWRAAAISMIPFVSVHLLMFAVMPLPVAVAALFLAVVISFPLAHLFELAGDSVWAPALLHFVIQGAVKVVVLAEGAEPVAIAWMAASAVVPLLVFSVRRRERPGPVAPV